MKPRTKLTLLSLTAITINTQLKTGDCCAQQILVNNGASITQTTNATILVKDGGLTNQNNGAFHNSGKIILTGNWINNANNFVFTSNNGTVDLSGADQTIGGSNTTYFNNLTLSGSGTKTLNINTLVGGGYISPTGVLSLNDRALDLNSQTLIVNNPLPTAIMKTSGYLISETEPSTGYGQIQWNIGNAANGSNYEYPFGTISGNYIPLQINITTSGTSSGTGSITAATYPTDATASPNNRELPTGVSSFLDKQGNENAPKAVDRFWITNAANYSSNPTATLVFTYLDEECDAIGGSTNTIKEDSLKAQAWKNATWQSPVGIDNPASNTLTATNINTYAPWRLSEIQEDITKQVVLVPNVFTPNNDTKNDVLHVLGNGIKELHLIIYDRWGEKIFETANQQEGWDGTYNGKPMNTAVFVYYLTAKLIDGTPITQKGNISLIR